MFHNYGRHEVQISNDWRDHDYHCGQTNPLKILRSYFVVTKNIEPANPHNLQPVASKETSYQQRTMSADATPSHAPLDHSHTKPKVRFSTLEIREYPVVLGTNPSTLRGPPVEIGWHSQSSRLLDLDLYEYERGQRRRRSEKQLVMSVNERVNRYVILTLIIGWFCRFSFCDAFWHSSVRVLCVAVWFLWMIGYWTMVSHFIKFVATQRR